MLKSEKSRREISRRLYDDEAQTTRSSSAKPKETTTGLRTVSISLPGIPWRISAKLPQIRWYMAVKALTRYSVKHAVPR